MKIREDILEVGYAYHIYNRGINSNLIFLNNENMAFFLMKTEEYLLPNFEIHGYCLMPDHFHFILKPKLNVDLDSMNFTNNKGLHSEESIYSKSIGKLVSSYTQSFNKVYRRTGPLLESPFKRILIDSEEYFRNLIIYIHQNPEDFQNYKFSSYKAVISSGETSISRNEIIALFDDRENFIKCHQKEIDAANLNFNL